jgi:hypothetical protein
MVWGGICRNYKSELLIFAHGETLDAATYIEKVWEQMSTIDSLNQIFGSGGWILQQDNAPAHHAKSAVQYLRTRVNVLEEWPPHSPDLNIIEIVRAWMKQRVMALHPRNSADLIEVLK